MPAAAVFTTNKAVARAGGRLARGTWRTQAAGCSAHRHQQRLRECRHRRRWHARGRRDGGRPRAEAVGCAPTEVLVASTGVIGVALDIDEGARAASRRPTPRCRSTGADAAMRAIMTTDPFPKSCAAAVDTPDGTITVGGMAKGSGMIEPRMATMLGYLTTDAKVEPAVLAGALQRVVNLTFNAITVDGECSTNDCVFILASGASGVAITREDDPRLIEPLMHVAGHLAREIVRGGEGATKLVTVRVTGAATDERRLAGRADHREFAAGEDGHPRRRSELGPARGGRRADRARRSISITRRSRLATCKLFVNGVPHDDRADAAAEVLKAAEVTVTVDLGHGGQHAATMWTCDFSAEYVKINAEYRT